ncbi:protein phosphatase 1 regulatory subunit 14C isoform X1 [Rattus norvegicus]|uniref:Protein phosphatase 1 regulatory subunit 14 n=1 Tax=Rattus norvegicus TaxID=10116 RepID=A0ABK0LCB5_RAT
MSVVTGGGEAAGGTSGGGARVFFQSPRGGTGGSRESSSHSGSSREDSAPVATVAAAGQVQQQQRRHQQGKVTVKYDRKELRKRLVLEEWIVEQLGQLYGCEEEEMPDVEIDIDDLLDADSEEERASKLQEALVDCYKPTEPLHPAESIPGNRWPKPNQRCFKCRCFIKSGKLLKIMRT